MIPCIQCIVPQVYVCGWWLPRIHISLFRLSYINTGELVLAQFIIPDSHDYDETVVNGDQQGESYWTKFLDRSAGITGSNRIY